MQHHCILCPTIEGEVGGATTVKYLLTLHISTFISCQIKYYLLNFSVWNYKVLASVL